MILDIVYFNYNAGYGDCQKIYATVPCAHFWTKSSGWRAAVTWTLYRFRTALGFPEPSTLEIKPHRAQFPVVARLGGSSDMDVFHQIFQFDEYACIRDIPAPRLILDLGAGIAARKPHRYVQG